jgi:Tfp pilus assembly protein PilO
MKLRKLPKGATVGLIVGGDILLLLMGWVLLVSPQRSTAQSTARSVQATEAQIIEARKPVVRPSAPKAPTQPEIKTAYLYKLSKAMPMTQDMPNLLLELSSVVRNSGVQLTSISPASPDPSGTTGVTLAVTGDFYSVTDLVYRLRGLVAVHDGALDVSGRLFTIKSIGLTPTGAGKGLNGSIALTTYTFAAQAAPAVTPTPASTDTTASASADAGVSP